MLAVVLSHGALATTNSTVTLSQSATLNLDTGAVGTAGGDLLFSGGLVLQGSATGLNLGATGTNFYNTVSRTLLLQAAAQFAQILPSSLAADMVIGVHTNGGNWAKLLVTAYDRSSVTIRFLTYTTAGPNAPAITQIQNNYSYTLEGLPGYGIAPGSIFIVKGSNLTSQAASGLQSSELPGLPTLLNGTSLSVTVNGETVTPAIYYTSSTQVAAVLPSNTPAGTGTITLTSNGQSSAPEQIQVVPSALGLGTVDGTGSGLALAQDAGYHSFSTTNSAAPGQPIILWGSGVGADTSNDDRTYPLRQHDLTGIPIQVYVGGLAANVLYRGRSQFPGLDQIVLTIPDEVPVGCSVSIVAVSGSIVSNSVTLPIARGGGTCVEPGLFPTADVLQSLSSKPFVTYGAFSIGTVTYPTGRSSSANATFFRAPGSVFAKYGTVASSGSCSTFQSAAGAQPAETYGVQLDTGTLSISGPAGSATLEPANPASATYSRIYPVSSSGGSFEFSGTGGQDVGVFKETLNVPPRIVATNQTSPTNPSQGLTVTWTGGASDTDVELYGEGSAVGGSVRVQFFCFASAAAGRFVIPSWVFATLPPLSGPLPLALSSQTNPQPFAVPGLDFAYGSASASFLITVSYQ